MAEVYLSSESSKNDLYEEMKQIYCINDILVNELDQLNSYLNKLVHKLKVKLINLEEIPLAEKIKRIIEKSKGSLELQKLLPELTTSMCDIIYDAVSKLFLIKFIKLEKDYLILLKARFSNFFAQMLFLYLGEEKRKGIIMHVTKKIEILIDNKYGECSVLFIFENDLSANEQNLILDNLNQKMLNLLKIPSFLRIAECIIALYPFSSVKYILDYSIDYLHEFLKTKEGYFFIRMITKSCKDSQILDKLLNKMTSDLVNFVLPQNGLLICQSFIYNVPLSNFSFIRSCSKHIDENRKSVENEYDMKHPLLIKLIKILVKNIKFMDIYNVRRILFCVLENSSKAFERVLFKDNNTENRKKMLKDLLMLNKAEDILLEIEKRVKTIYYNLIIAECHDFTMFKTVKLNESIIKFIKTSLSKIKQLIEKDKMILINKNISIFNRNYLSFYNQQMINQSICFTDNLLFQNNNQFNKINQLCYYQSPYSNPINQIAQFKHPNYYFTNK